MTEPRVTEEAIELACSTDMLDADEKAVWLDLRDARAEIAALKGEVQSTFETYYGNWKAERAKVMELEAAFAAVRNECDEGRCPSAQHERVAALLAIARLKEGQTPPGLSTTEIYAKQDADRLALVERAVLMGMRYLEPHCSGPEYELDAIAARVIAEHERGSK